jgi:hypothetical protein
MRVASPCGACPTIDCFASTTFKSVLWAPAPCTSSHIPNCFPVARPKLIYAALFLQGMIKHHEGAIVMAQDVATSMNKDVANLSAAIIAAQKLEIAEMKELLLKN